MEILNWRTFLIYLLIVLLCVFAGFMVGYVVFGRQYHIQNRTIRELEQQLTDAQYQLTDTTEQANAIVAVMAEELGTNANTIQGIRNQLYALRKQIEALQNLYANRDSGDDSLGSLDYLEGGK